MIPDIVSDKLDSIVSALNSLQHKSFSVEAVLNSLPSSVARELIKSMCVSIDHVGIVAHSDLTNDLKLAIKAMGWRCKSFPSMIASLEKKNPITILDVSGGALPVEILVSKAPYAVPHIALSVKFKSQLNTIISSMESLGHKLPSFMRGSYMENSFQKVALVYFDVGDSRLEFIYKGS